ncbi:hypothetical protein NCDO763_1396 [Lactococcus cremoris]|uniref:Uncharacterized protein n=1 Tax=Lactococcus lactis subsp. cremoris (strain MG1363) TaxID=416870 RepID=A2RM35_LACLM|nr:hypothetical protein N41_2256 [Lactococcus cremoris]KZK51270.1 hypothetical protein NCDO763_1396 [Lactococcus cremoris]CAL98362.1 hypothetical protein predicted by Glimmer/Critica [Lactococcus cremoris subsp. cremoris MG1363]
MVLSYFPPNEQILFAFISQCLLYHKIYLEQFVSNFKTKKLLTEVTESISIENKFNFFCQ